MTLSNNKRGEQIAQNLKDWVAEVESQGKQIDWLSTTGKKAYQGVKRKELASLLGVSISTLNGKNAAPILMDVEYRWSALYAKQKEADSKAVKSEIERATEGKKRAEKKSSQLEGDNITLQAEIRLLRARLRKYEAIDELLQKTARAPRNWSEGE